MLWTLLLTSSWIATPLEIPNLAEYEGRRLGHVRVVDFAQSEITDGKQVVELTLQGAHRWQARCLKRGVGARFSLVCRLDAPGQPALTLSLADGGEDEWRGIARVPEQLSVVAAGPPNETRVDGLPVFSARFVDADGLHIADWQVGLRSRMRVQDTVDPAQRERFAALTLTLDIAGGRWSTAVTPMVLDGYPIRPGKAPTQWDRLRPDHHATANDPHLLVEGPRLDRASGVLVEREGDAGRLVMGLTVGGVTGSTAAPAAPDGLDQFTVDVSGGMRIGRRSHMSLIMGLQAGAHTRDDAHLALGAFGLGLQARHAFSIGAIEPVVGARARARFRFGEATSDGGATQADAAQFGLGLAPLVGVQWPMTLNRFDTRLVVFLEAAPEWSFWTAPSLDAEESALAGTMRDALQRRDWAVGTTLGVRFEL